MSVVVKTDEERTGLLEEFQDARCILHKFLADLVALEAVDAIDGDEVIETAIARAADGARSAAREYIKAFDALGKVKGE